MRGAVITLYYHGLDREVFVYVYGFDLEKRSREKKRKRITGKEPVM